MRKKRRTARELMQELESDPEWVARRARRERERERAADVLRADEAVLVQELRSLGYTVGSVWDFVNNVPHAFLDRPFTGTYEKAYPVLIAHLDVAHEHKVREGIIRALTVKDGGETVQKTLLRQLGPERNQELRWVLANALRTAMPYRERRKNPTIAEALEAGTGLGGAE